MRKEWNENTEKAIGMNDRGKGEITQDFERY